LAFLVPVGFLKCRQKCKKSGTLKPPRAAIMTNEPIQSKLEYRLDLAVSIDMLVWVTKPVLLILWDIEVMWFADRNKCYIALRKCSKCYKTLWICD
jgi:hypothetical protein